MLPAVKPVDVEVVLDKEEDKLCSKGPRGDEAHLRDCREEGGVDEHPRDRECKHVTLNDAIHREIVKELWPQEGLSFRVRPPSFEQNDRERTKNNRRRRYPTDAHLMSAPGPRVGGEAWRETRTHSDRRVSHHLQARARCRGSSRQAFRV